MYPLHLATLNFVATPRSGIIYSNHDIWHFGLQLLFACSGRLNRACLSKRQSGKRFRVGSKQLK